MGGERAPFEDDIDLVRDTGEPVSPWHVDTSLFRHRKRRRWVFRRAPRQLELFGVSSGDAIVDIDGDPVRHPDQVIALVRRLPAYPPRRLVVESVSADSSREIHFVDRAAMEALGQRFPEPKAWTESACTTGNCFGLRARVDALYHVASFDPRRARDLRWATLAGEIHRVADTFFAPVAPTPDPIACSELRTLPTVIGLSLPDGTSRELRYVGAFTQPHKLQAVERR